MNGILRVENHHDGVRIFVEGKPVRIPPVGQAIIYNAQTHLNSPRMENLEPKEPRRCP